MKNVRITVIRKVCHKDLMERYENPIEHACDLHEGQVFVSDGMQRPEWRSRTARRTSTTDGCGTPPRRCSPATTGSGP